MTTQPEALRLADDMLNCSFGRTVTVQQAAAELRRLHEANEAFGKRQEWWNERMFVLEQQRDALLKTMKWLDNWLGGKPMPEVADKIRAAIAKAESKP